MTTILIALGAIYGAICIGAAALVIYTWIWQRGWEAASRAFDRSIRAACGHDHISAQRKLGRARQQ